MIEFVKRMGQPLALGLTITALVACGGGSGSSAGGAPATGTTSTAPYAASGVTVVATSVPVANAGASTSSASWSNPAVWGGRVPKTGDKVVIPQGIRVEFDASSPRLAGLTVMGELVVPQGARVSLTADFIMVMGPTARLQAGTAAAGFDGQFDLILSGTDTTLNVMGHGAKVVMVMDGGTLSLHGQRKRGYSRLDASVAPGARTLLLADEPTAWQVGDEIALAPTDFDALQAERRRITAIQGRSVTVDAAFDHAHWGGAPQLHGGLRLDMRAHVGNLTRNIRLSSIENEDRLLPGFDPTSRNSAGRQDGAGKRPGVGRFGGHMTVMTGSYAQLDSVEITQFGQQGMLARYPVHWHLTGDTSKEGNYIRHSAVHQTFQRGIVIHQSNGIEVEDNVLFDIPGHGVYLEDGIERDNVIDRNLVMLIRYVPRKYRLSVLDTEKDRAEKLSGLWITNPANLIRDNVVAGVQNGWGFIFANVLDDKIPVIPRTDLNWVDNRGYAGFSGNTAYAIGFMQAVPDGGDSVFNLGYGPEEAGSCFRFNFSGDVAKSTQTQGLTAFKCANAASWSTNFLPIRRSVFADSRVSIVNNQGEAGISRLQESAVVGMTANNPAARKDLTFGPFPGPVLKEHLESAPVTFDNVVAAGGFSEQLDGMAPALTAASSPTAGFRLQLPAYAAVKANGSVSIPVAVDRAGGYRGAVTVSVEVPKPPNLAEENPYHPLTGAAAQLPADATAGTLVLNQGAAARPASVQVAVVKAVGDATVLSTLRLFTSTPPLAAATGTNLSRLIPGDSPRNPQMSSVVQNAGGRFAVDGDSGSSARFEGGTAPWIRLDLERSYALGTVTIEWDPALRPTGPLVLSISEFSLLDVVPTLAEALTLPAAQATHVNIPDTGASRIEIPWPAGTAVRQAKLWITQVQAGEIRLREIALIAR